MFDLSGIAGVYVCQEATDMRKGMYRLAAYVEQEMELSPFAPYLYVFMNRGKTQIKILYWNDNGFWLWQKRLEKGKYILPWEGTKKVLRVQELRWILEGIQPIKHPAQREKKARKIC